MYVSRIHPQIKAYSLLITYHATCTCLMECGTEVEKFNISWSFLVAMKFVKYIVSPVSSGYLSSNDSARYKETKYYYVDEESAGND